MRWFAIAFALFISACGDKQALDPKGFRGVKPGKPTARTVPAAAVASVEAIFQAHCYSCHGKDGSSDGGFDFADDLARIAASSLVTLGNAEVSQLYRRMAAGEMPPATTAERLSEAELQAVKAWIDQGAPSADAPQRLIPLAEVKGLIDKNFAALEAESRQGSVYFDLSHIYSGGTAKQTNLARDAFFKFVNSVSSAPTVLKPEPLNAEATIYRLELAAFGWQPTDFDRLLSMHPFPLEAATLDQQGFPRPGGIVREPIDTDVIRRPIALQTIDRPKYLRLDWFVKTASRGSFYYDLLDTPSRLFLLEQKLGIDTVANLQSLEVDRAGFANSQVAAQNRVIERHNSPNGAYWRTFEFGTSQGLKNIFQSPLGPGSVFLAQSEKRFIADGHEVIYHLPNGMLAFAIFNGDGNRLDVAPSGQSDAVKENSTVNVGVSCMSCHNAGFVDKADQVKDSLALFPDLFTAEELSLTQSLYKDAALITARISADSKPFHEALATLSISPDGDDPVSSLARRYLEPLTTTEAAAYLGLSKEELIAAIKESKALQQLLAGQVAANAVDRRFWEQNFRQIERIVTTGVELGGASGVPSSIDPPNLGGCDDCDDEGSKRVPTDS